MFIYINNDGSHLDSISNSISLNSETHNLHTRARSDIKTTLQPCTSLTSFIYQAVKVWNSLPNEYKSSVFINKFRAKLKKILYSVY